MSILLLCCFANNANAQFVNVASQQNIAFNSIPGFYGNGLSAKDFNQDGWDDLTICTHDFGVKTYLNNQGNFEEVLLFDTLSGDIKQPIWLDFDNDGDQDFFATRIHLPMVLMRNDGDLTFTDISSGFVVPVGYYNTFGCSWGDYDNDGFLDVYICNYNMLDGVVNWMYHNNGDGSFTEVAESLGMTNGSLPTFQSTWIDYDLDGDQDLYVANDRHFGNPMFRNNGDGTFTDVSIETNCALNIDAMCISWSDYDLDGDFDLFVTNTEDGCALMNNTSGVFSNFAVDSPVLCDSTISWGSLWIDAENDGYDDLYVANNAVFDSNQNYFLSNEGNGQFTSNESLLLPTDNFASYSVAAMDFDNNGAEDFAVSNIFPASLSLWQNTPGTNHYIKVGLTGTTSNSDGIGSIIKVYSQGQMIMRPVLCGEGFITQNSSYELFGLGESSLVDTITVHWPSGWIDRYYGLASDSLYLLVEGSGVQLTSYIVESYQFCYGDSILLNPGEFSSYEWQDGSANSSLYVYESGEYTVNTVDASNAPFSYTFFVEETEEISVTQTTQNVSCYGASNGVVHVLVNNAPAEVVNWKGVLSTNEIAGLEAGIYSFEVVDDFGCHHQNSVEVIQPDPISVFWSADTVCYGSTADVNYYANGGTGKYTFDWQGFDPNAMTAGDYQLIVTDENNCMQSETIEVIEFDPIIVEMDYQDASDENDGWISLEVTGGSPPFSYEWNNGSFIDDITQLGEGWYICAIADSKGCEAEAEVHLNTILSVDGNKMSDNIYPVPFSDHLHMQFVNSQTFTVTDSTGKLIYSSDKPNDRFDVDTSNWSEGFYVIRTAENEWNVIKEK